MAHILIYCMHLFMEEVVLVLRVQGLALFGGVQVSGFAALRSWLRDLGFA